jgi:hypothetical protein
MNAGEGGRKRGYLTEPVCEAQPVGLRWPLHSLGTASSTTYFGSPAMCPCPAPRNDPACWPAVGLVVTSSCPPSHPPTGTRAAPQVQGEAPPALHAAPAQHVTGQQPA